jgi:hypothetical protein
MQNLDPVFILQPIKVVSLSIGLILYWRFKRNFRWSVLFYTLVAYGVAIALKDVLQVATASAMVFRFGFQSIPTAAYYGLQTVLFEVGIAYLIAWYATSQTKLNDEDAEAYGLGLGFWENGVLLGILPLINLITYYATLAFNTPFASTLYAQLQLAQPSLFYPASQALPLVGLGILERISSMLLHFSWGYLCLMAVFYHEKRLFLIALPMGIVDAIVPFAEILSLPVFEAVIFGLSILALAIALFSTSHLRKKASAASAGAGSAETQLI